MTAADRVLIVVPTLGARADYLESCLDSLRAQTHRNLRVVLVGPGEGPVPAFAAAAGLPFVREPRPGIGAAVNAGWRAHGDDAVAWGWLGDDDLLPPDSVSLALAALQVGGVVMSYGQCEYMDAEGRVLWCAKPGRLASLNLRRGVDLIPQPGSLARAATVRAVGMVDEGLRYAMDYDLFIRLRRAGRFAYVPRVLARFRWHEESLTAATGSGSEAEAAEVRARYRAGATGPAHRAADSLAMKASKLHWHLQRRPVSVMLDGLRQSFR